MDIKKALGQVGSLIPFLGAAFRTDETKSEYDVAMSSIAASFAIPDVEPWIRVVCATAVAVVYMVIRTTKKNTEAKSAG